MSLLQTYLDDNGYDYYGNAAEDTLVFFVHYEDKPMPSKSESKRNETVSNLTDETVDNTSGNLPFKAAVVNKKATYNA